MPIGAIVVTNVAVSAVSGLHPTFAALRGVEVSLIANEALISLLGGRRVFGRAPIDLVSRVRAGIPYAAYERAVSELDLELALQARLMAVSVRKLQRMRETEAALDASMSDRVVRVMRIFADAMTLFADKRRAVKWLRSGNDGLGGAAPLDLLDTDIGAQRVEESLDRLRYGVPL